MQRYLPIQWARQTVTGDQDGADGSRLVDLYAVNPAALPTAPDQAKTQVLLYPAPLVSAWSAAPALGGSGSTINGLKTADNPVFGNRVVALFNGNRVAEFVIADGGSVTKRYEGFFTCLLYTSPSPRDS